MNFDYGQTVSKQGLWEAISVLTWDQLAGPIMEQSLLHNT